MRQSLAFLLHPSSSTSLWAPDGQTHLGLTRSVCVMQQKKIRTICPSFNLSPLLSLSCSTPVQAIVKLLIIIPWQEMIGRLRGTPAGATRVSRRANHGEPQDVSIKENGSRWGGRGLHTSTCDKRGQYILMRNQEHGWKGKCFWDHLKCVWKKRPKLGIISQQRVSRGKE